MTLPILLAALMGCGDKDPTTDTAAELPCEKIDATVTLTDPDGDGTISSSTDKSAAFDVYLLTSNNEAVRSITFNATHNEESYEVLVTENTTDLATSTDGKTYSFTWPDTTNIIPIGQSGEVTLEAIVLSECGYWEKVSENFLIDNTAVAEPVCTISLETPLDDDGTTPLRFNVQHPNAESVDVRAFYSDDGGASYQNINIAYGVDCNGDGVADDNLDGLATSAEGTSHCVNWDSDSQISENQSATIKVECYSNSGDLEDEAVSEEFLVQNDRTPRSGDLLISEIMTESGATLGNYIEVFNDTDHTLNLHGTKFSFWYSDSPTTDTADGSHTIETTSETLLIAPGEYSYFAADGSAAATGCLSPDDSWNAQEFSLPEDASYVVFNAEDEVVTSFDFLEPTWGATRRSAVGMIDPGVSDPYDSDNWCLQTQEIVCSFYTGTKANYGTPGEASVCE